MVRLLWKELRERGWWLGLWALAILVIAGFDSGRWWSDSGIINTPALGILYIFTILVGATAYTSEMGNTGRISFLMAQPIRWQAVLGTKILVGLFVAIIIPLCAGVLYKSFGLPTYRIFVTGHNILVNAWPFIWSFSLLYLVGLACSVLLTGLAGGILTFLGIMLITITAYIFLPAFFTTILYPTAHDYAYSLRELAQQVSIIVGTIIGACFAGFSLARYGLTLEVDERLKRFVSTFLLLFVLIWVTGLLLPTRLADRLLLQWQASDMRLSPGGNYLVTISFQRFVIPGFLFLQYENHYDETSGFFFQHSTCLQRIEKNGSALRIKRIWKDQFAKISDTMYSESFWVNNNVLGSNGFSHEGFTLFYANSGRIATFPGMRIRLTPNLVSPGGHYLTVRTQIDHTLKIIDLYNAYLLPITINNVDVDNLYNLSWTNSTTLSYYTPDRKQHRFIDVSASSK